MRKVLIAMAAGVVILGACGSKSSSDKADSPTVSTTASSSAATTSSSAAAAPTTASPSSTTSAGGTATAAATADVALSEWKIESGPIKSGAVTFNTKNAGKFPHELRVFKGSVAELPKAADGSVNESALAPGTLVGKVDRLEAGATGSVTVNLAPGRYVLVCNLVAAGQSHAAKGQIIDVTVS